MSTDVIGEPSMTTTPGYTGATYTVELNPCCGGEVLRGEECCPRPTGELDVLPAIVWDRRSKRAAA